MTPLEIFILYVAPIWFFISIIIIIAMEIILPRPARVLRKLRFKRGSVLGIFGGDEGLLRFEILKPMPQGTFKVLGSKRQYYFLPRPKFSSMDVDAEHRLMDEELLKKHIVDGLGKPVYVGYTGKCVVGPVNVLNQFELSDDLKKLSQETGLSIEEIKKRLTDSEKVKKVAPVELWLNALDPRRWKEYLKLSFNQATIDALCYTHEQIGYEGRPKSGFPVIAAVVILAVAVLAIILVMSGAVKIPGVM